MVSKNILQRAIVILFVMLCSVTFAQKLDMDLLKGIKPRSIGPAGMSGRVTAIDVVLNNPDIIYVGSASGGLWRSTSGGANWKPIFDEQPAASIGALAIDQNAPDVIWVGTGEGNPRNSQTSGNGVYKSLDGGKTWKCMGLEGTRNIHRLIIDPTNSNTVYVGSQGSPWGESSDRGVFKTTDGGKTWRKILFVDTKTGLADLVMDPSNPNKLVAAMWQFMRWPWFLKSGGSSSGIFITYDGGETWQRKTDKDGLPKGELGRIGLAIARNNPKIIYALIEAKKNALYKTEDGGFKWQLVSDENVSNRPFYYHEIYVDPENELRIYNLFSSVTISEDGGKTFRTLISTRAIHPDHHAWWIHPKNGSYIIDGNDGGLAISRDRGKSWSFIGNLPLGQFYHINVDMEKPYNIMGGLQDNGTWFGPSSTLSRSGLRNSNWIEVGGGDGFDSAVDQLDSKYLYSMSQGGAIQRVDLSTGDSKSIRPVHPKGERLRFNWNAGFAQDPINKSVIYYGSQFLHKSSDMGNSWQIISPDLTTNDPSKQKGNESGGLTYDATGAENYTTILTIDASPVKEGVIWVGTDDGNLQLTKDGGQTWENVIKNIKGVPEGSWIPQVRAGRYKAEEAFVIINNYRRDDWKPYVFKTTDFGKTWNAVVTEKDVAGYALTFIQDIVEPNLYFLGTEFGLYVSIDAGKNWSKWTNGYPTVSTYDLAIHAREHDLIVGTFGRSIYVFDDIRPLRKMASEGASFYQKKLQLFEVPEAIQYASKPTSGMSYTPANEYVGENLTRGARISFYANIDSLKETDRLKMEYFDNSNKLIKTSYQKIEKGLTRTIWSFDQKGVRFPGTPKLKENEEPFGPSVFPGEYKLKISFKNFSDSTNIKVSSDPRLDVKKENLIERYNLYKELFPKIENVTALVDRLADCEKLCAFIDEKIKDKNLADLKKLSKAIKDSIKILRELVIAPSVQGIYSNDNLVSTKLRRAYGAAIGYWDKPGDSEKIALAQAETSYQFFIGRVNNFYDKEWRLFKESVDKNNIVLIDNYNKLD